MEEITIDKDFIDFEDYTKDSNAEIIDDLFNLDEIKRVNKETEKRVKLSLQEQEVNRLQEEIALYYALQVSKKEGLCPSRISDAKELLRDEGDLKLYK